MGSGVQELSILYTVQGCDMTSDCNYADQDLIKNRTKGKIGMGKKSKNTQRLGKSMMSLWSQGIGYLVSARSDWSIRE